MTQKRRLSFVQRAIGIMLWLTFVGRPTFAFGKCAFHFSNISSVDLNSVVVEEIERNIGRFSLVFKRVG